MADVIHRGEGTEYPDFIAVDQRNGLIRLTIRGEPRPVPDGDGLIKLEPGATVTLAFSRAAMARLVHRMLALPPIEEAVEGKPFVLYFDRASERQAFIETMRQHVPMLMDRSLDREKESGG